MDWKYENFKKMISEYFIQKGWTLKQETKDVLEKNYTQQFFSKQHRKYLVDDSLFYEKLHELFATSSLKKMELKSLKNEKSDTDLIIAGYQTVINQIDFKTMPEHASYYSFQPVIRLNGLSECGVIEGFLSSFVNICLVDVNTTMDEYIHNIDLWITILSKLSLHSSGIQLVFKNKTNAFDGLGVEFQYKGIEIGQANLYQYVNGEQKFLISDFGFGYERILWVINGGKSFFDPIVDKYDIIHSNIKECDRIRTAVLLIMNGIIPATNGVGKYSRMLISQAPNIGLERYLDLRVLRYYTFYKKFIEPKLSYEQTIRILRSEIDYCLLKQDYIVAGYNFPKHFTGSIFLDYESLYYKKENGDIK